MEINSSGTSKGLHDACPIIHFYFYRIDTKNYLGAKWSRALALLLQEEKPRLLKSLVREVFEERLQHNVT
jgi:hypothetical protein